jgi:arabinofuranan 3-O-arabinosyltransferase
VTAPAGTVGRVEPTERLGARWPDRVRSGLTRDRLADLLVIAIPAFIAYIPLLVTQRGQVAADTKTYLYLDPGKILRDAPYVWDSQIGLGTVTHQNIGYLWPMGPFYWFFETLGFPDWVAQRLWLGSVMFTAAMGVRWLLRTLDWGGVASHRGGLLVASLAYMLSPYLLDYSARISVILLPWAALPWLIGLTIRAVREGGWRHAALFALVVQTVGGINATALILIGFGPLLWLIYAVWIERSEPFGKAMRAFWRIGLLTIAASMWWIAGLWAEGKYGLPVIRYTESYKTVSEVSSAPEVMRGLGYWFFYGTDKLGPWIEPSVTYTERVPFLALSYLLPVLALLSAALLRWRLRVFFILLVVIGSLIAIGSHPWAEPSPLGAIFKALTRTDAGLSMRSLPRAVPLVALGTAVFLGVGVASLAQRMPRPTRLVVPAVAVLLVVANLPTLWQREMVASNLRRHENIPTYWIEASDYLDGRMDDTRVLEVPGSDFAAYRWGNTVDPVAPGLMERPYVARELFVWGSAPSANLLNAFDRRFHENDIDPEAIAPVSQLMAAGDLTLRGDLQYERFRTARPRQMWDLLTGAPGLGEPAVFGPNVPNIAGPEQPLVDEIELDAIDHLEYPPEVAVFPVLDPLPILRTYPATRPLLVAGDGDGLVDAAGIGLLDPRRALFYSASYAQDASGFDVIYGQQADLLVTDTNRKRSRRWGTLRETTGYTETAGERPLSYDPGDQRLELFPGAGDDAYTVTELRGVESVRATGYGNPITYTPNDRAAMALDGDLETAWRVAAVDDPTGERLIIDLVDPVTTDQITLTQPTTLFRNRWITEVRLHFADQPPVDVTLGAESRQAPGQVVTFDERTFEHLEIEILATDVGKRPRYDGLSAVGFSEVDIDGIRVEELVRPPTDLLDRAGPSSLDHRLAYVFTRLRSNPSEPVRTDEEVSIARIMQVPTERSFGVGAHARLSAYITDDEIDRLLGIPDASQGGVTATSDERLAGSLERRAYSAVDGDVTTHWSTIFTKQEGHHVGAEVAAPITVDHLDMQIVADGRHSVPTQLFLVVDGDRDNPITLDIPPLTDSENANHVVHVPIDLPEPITGKKFEFFINQVRHVQIVDWYSGDPINMPVAIAELGIPGVQAPPLPERFDSGCRDDLLLVDETSVPLRVTGTVEAALRKERLDVTPCGSGGGTITLDAGEHVVRTATGRDMGIDLDRLSFTSGPGGAAMTVTDSVGGEAPAAPPVTIVDPGRVSYDAEIDAKGEPFWLAVGQSWSEGWHATANGRDLGPPQVIAGYGNGWLVQPEDDGPVSIAVEWTPQRVVWLAIAFSLVTVLACLVLIFVGWRRRPPRAVPVPGDAEATLQLPMRGERDQVTARAALMVSILLGVFVFLNVPFAGFYPLAGPAVGVATYLAFRWKRGRAWLALAGAGLFAAAALYIVSGQIRHRYISDFTWPLQFTRAHILGLLALFLLLADGLRSWLARSRDDERLQPDEPARLPSDELVDDS